MSEPLSEAAGCALLARLFRKRGYAIRRNVAFREKGISFDIDGWDAKARVGFEFLSSEKDDHDDLSLEEFERLKDAEQRGELFIFVVDEVEPLSADALGEAAESFLDEVDTARARLRSSPRRAAVSTKPRSGPSAGRSGATVRGKAATKKTAAVKVGSGPAVGTRRGGKKAVKRVAKSSGAKAKGAESSGAKRAASATARAGRRRSGR